MLKTGLTGSIGSGKSTVSRIFSSLGIPVYDADTEAKRLSARPEVRQKIAELFGEAAATDKKKLAAIVFNDPQELARLNALIHPLVFEDSRQWFRRLAALPTPPPYAIVESAILFDCGMAPMFDFIIDVEAPLEEQIQRSQARDHSSREAILARLEKQMPAAERMNQSDFIVHNGSEDRLLPQILQIDHFLRKENTASASILPGAGH